MVPAHTLRRDYGRAGRVPNHVVNDGAEATNGSVECRREVTWHISGAHALGGHAVVDCVDGVVWRRIVNSDILVE